MHNAAAFERVWQLPNCVASVAGKYMQLKGRVANDTKTGGGIVIVAACDADHTFVAIDVGTANNGSSDGGVFANDDDDDDGSFATRLFSDSAAAILRLPKAVSRPNSTKPLPATLYLAGDTSMPLKRHLMRPYPRRETGDDETKDYFNRRLSDAGRVIENAFGVLLSRWRILRGTKSVNRENVERIVRATIVLHNFVKSVDALYCPDGMVDVGMDGELVAGSWRETVVPLAAARFPMADNPPRSAFLMRDKLAIYLFENQARAE